MAPVAIEGHARDELADGWELAASAPGAHGAPPLDLPFDRGPDRGFGAAIVPGTVATSLGDAAASAADDQDWWFRCRFAAAPAAAGERLLLTLDGVATLAEAWLNGTAIGTSATMFAPLEADVTALLAAENELVLVCRSIRAALRVRRPRPRWRTRVVAEQQLRYLRATILGRAPGFAPGPPPVGPFRPVALERQRAIAADAWTLRAGLDPDGTGTLDLATRLLHLDGRAVTGATLVADGPTGAARAPLAVAADGDASAVSGRLAIPSAAAWLPHTHGTPHRYEVAVEVALDDGSTIRIDAAPVGFRSLASGVAVAGDDGLALAVSGVPVFARGVLWVPVDPSGLASPVDELRRRLELLRDGGVNMVRIAGTVVYETEDFHRLCDELGILVWQDLMLANMDYPADDPEWAATFRAETRGQLVRLARHPSTAVVCGGSEVEQQAGMVGVAPEAIRSSLTRELVPDLIAELCPELPFVPSSPCGGDLPFRTGSGVAHYFGVGAYLRPLEDARRSGVRFASECLAFANVPEQALVDAMASRTPGGISPTHPAWKAGTPRDVGSGWDFEDVRDHYLRLLYDVDPQLLRTTDVDLYLDLSRLVSGEAMADVAGEWRRQDSPCAGMLILQAADLAPGAGWGVLDITGTPKAAYWFLRRAWSPLAVWTTDEGLDGIDVHVANDTAEAIAGTLAVRLVRASGTVAVAASTAVAVEARSVLRRGVEELVGHFVDASYAYRFGPRGHDLVVASFTPDAGATAPAESIRWIGPRPTTIEPVDGVGLAATARRLDDGTIAVELAARRPVWGVRVTGAGCAADDAWFGVVPGGTRQVRLRPDGEAPAALSVVGANLHGRLVVDVTG